MEKFSNMLTKYEQKEIKEYKKIYYIGQKANFAHKEKLSADEKFDN